MSKFVKSSNLEQKTSFCKKEARSGFVQVKTFFLRVHCFLATIQNVSHNSKDFVNVSH